MKTMQQRDLQDCGVTCLEYIIEYYHGHVPIEKLREDTCTDKDGTSAYHLVETLKKYGFDSFGKKITCNDLNQDLLPAIVHIVLPNGLNHFVVLVKSRKYEVVLMDPMIGKRTISKKEFEYIWDGVILFAIPQQKIPVVPKEKSIFSVLFYFAKKEKKIFGLIILCSVLTTLLTIVNGTYFKIALESQVSFDRNTFLAISFVFFIVFIFRFLFGYFKNYLTFFLNKNIETNYIYAFLKHVFSFSVTKFFSYHEGDIITRVQNAFEIKGLFQDICITFFLELIMILFSFFILFWLNWQLTLVLLIGMLLYVGISLIIAKPFYFMILEMLEEDKKWQEKLLESIRIFLTMKHLNQTSYVMNRVESAFCVYEESQLKYQKKLMLQRALRENFLEFLFFILLTYGVWLVCHGEITLLSFITFQSLYVYFVSPLKAMADIAPKFCYMKGVIKKISEMAHLKVECSLEKECSLKPASIKINKLSYSYNQCSFVLKDIQFQIKAKEHVFLQGPSGCGKSTICKILHGEINDYKGEVLLDGKNLKDYSLADIRSSILYLSQKENIFMGSIRENILFGSKEDERFSKVCKICRLEEVVANKPLRYETCIQDYNVSGGEKQRIVLARILLKEASFYLLDECLSEVDEDLEVAIIKDVRKYLKGKNILYISHKNHQDLFERSIKL